MSESQSERLHKSFFARLGAALPRTPERIEAFFAHAAEFDSLPDAAQICLLRRMALFESCEDWWYEIYLEEGVRFQATEFDSFDDYWELESANQEEFKLELLKQCLRDPWESNGCNGEAAKLILEELDEILKTYHLQYWADPYCGFSLCIG